MTIRCPICHRLAEVSDKKATGFRIVGHHFMDNVVGLYESVSGPKLTEMLSVQCPMSGLPTR